jgi:capsular polysaccharide transport system permease protein
VTSGVWFVADALPDTVRHIIAYHPVLQVVEWMRSAYYEGYGSLVLDRSYVIEFGCVTIFCGLLLERAMRGHILALR